MLKIKILDKITTSKENILSLWINDNKVDVERVGNMIYVNGVNINLAIIEKKTPWFVKVMMVILMISMFGALAAALYYGEEISAVMNPVVQFVVEWGGASITWIQGLIGS